jgi:hypothetical protein
MEGKQAGAAGITCFQMPLNSLIERGIRLVRSRPGTVPVVLDLSIAQMLKLLVHFAHDSIDLNVISPDHPFLERNTMVFRNFHPLCRPRASGLLPLSLLPQGLKASEI